MDRRLFLVAVVSAFLAMGISMPSCPGQQAMQQQIDGLNTKNGELTKKMQTMDNQLKGMAGEMGQMKELLAQVSNTVLAQKTAIEQLEAAMKAAPKGKAGGKKRR
jgi:septal ring factor EnvC (AmiA/AmiB activator)